jgi:hypothetical protein
MLAHVAGSVSTDLNVWERMANPCVSQADCHSATTASVVWLLALDFIFTLCVSPCPGILILDVVQTRSFLDWSHTGAFDFSRLCLYQHWSWGQGGSSLNLIQALESIVILEAHECTSSVSTWYRKNGVWSSILAWWRMKRVTCFAGWRMELYARHTPRLCEHL